MKAVDLTHRHRVQGALVTIAHVYCILIKHVLGLKCHI